MENDNTKNQGVELLPCPASIVLPVAVHVLNTMLAIKDAEGRTVCNFYMGPSITKDYEAKLKEKADFVANAMNTRNPASSRMTENEANKNVGDLVELVARAINDSLPSDMRKWNVKDMAKAALSVIRQQSSVKVDDGWQPIETAPKDGQTIRIWDGKGQADGYWMMWAREKGVVVGLEDEPQDQYVDHWQWIDGFEISEPTHWQPLPNPPIALRSSEMPNGSGKED